MAEETVTTIDRRLIIVEQIANDIPLIKNKLDSIDAKLGLMTLVQTKQEYMEKELREKAECRDLQNLEEKHKKLSGAIAGLITLIITLVIGSIWQLITK